MSERMIINGKMTEPTDKRKEEQAHGRTNEGTNDEGRKEGTDIKYV